jgi:hypothetical protein
MVNINSYMFRLCSVIFRKSVKTSPTFQHRCWSPSLSSLLNMMYFTRSIWKRSLWITHIEADIVYNTSSCKLVLAKTALVSQHCGFVFCWVHFLLNILNQGLMCLKKTDMIQRNKKSWPKNQVIRTVSGSLEHCCQQGLCIEGCFLQNNSLRK